MNKLEIGVALIRRIKQQIHWLGKHDRGKNQIDFVIAQRLEKESWREAVMREVAWELDIDRKREIIVSNMAQLNVEFEAVLPGESELSKISCAFYNVELYRRGTADKVAENEDFVWLTSNEICDGVTKSGIPISPLVMLLNAEAKVIQHWESDALGE